MLKTHIISKKTHSDSAARAKARLSMSPLKPVIAEVPQMPAMKFIDRIIQSVQNIQS